MEIVRKTDDEPIVGYEELADTLQRMQAPHNGGRGISCVRLVVTYLKQGAFLAATAVARNEYDKIESYPEIADLVNRRILNTDRDREMRKSICGDEYGVAGRIEARRAERRSTRV